jgi:hypothetical protein
MEPKATPPGKKEFRPGKKLHPAVLSAKTHPD